MAQILVQDVTKTYAAGARPLHAVFRASLSVEKGDFISIVGHSGSGKTTLLSLIGGITYPTSGAISFEGLDIGSLDSDGLSAYRSEKTGFMFQFASLLPMLTVKENLLLPAVFGRSSGAREEDAAKAQDLIRLVGLADKTGAYPAELSGGQQRRVAIARAFMNDPAVILADEPTGDLDEETEDEMMKFFRSMNENRGVTFIMVTHNAAVAGQAKRRFRMHRGAIAPY